MIAQAAPPHGLAVVNLGMKTDIVLRAHGPDAAEDGMLIEVFLEAIRDLRERLGLINLPHRRSSEPAVDRDPD